MKASRVALGSSGATADPAADATEQAAIARAAIRTMRSHRMALRQRNEGSDVSPCRAVASYSSCTNARTAAAREHRGALWATRSPAACWRAGSACRPLSAIWWPAWRSDRSRPGFQGRPGRHPPDGGVRRHPADVRRRPALLLQRPLAGPPRRHPRRRHPDGDRRGVGLRRRRAAGAFCRPAPPGSSASRMSVASTVVLMRALMDHGWLDTPHGKVAIGWLVVEDLLMRRHPRAAARAGRTVDRPGPLGHGRASRSARRCCSSR